MTVARKRLVVTFEQQRLRLRLKEHLSVARSVVAKEGAASRLLLCPPVERCRFHAGDRVDPLASLQEAPEAVAEKIVASGEAEVERLLRPERRHVRDRCPGIGKRYD